jgi:glycogen(starch) synthase
MRLLFVSNFYPPAHLGGKEIRCQEVVQGLQSRGHICLVLTSDFAPPGVPLPDQPGVRRMLALEAGVYYYCPFDHLLHHPARLRANLNVLKAAVSESRPDLVFIWGTWNLSPALAAAAEELLPGRVVYSFGGCTPIEPDVHEQFWRVQDGKWSSQQIRRVLAPFALSRRYRPVQARALRFEHAITCSQFVLARLREAGLALPNARVVFSGIDVNHFVPGSLAKSHTLNGLKVIYAGGIASHKGVHTAIKAIHLLVEQGRREINLTIVGQGHPAYRASLKEMVARAALEKWVHFQPPVPRCDMHRLLHQFDVLVLPTLMDEPLSRVVMEAMACGLVVVASNNGGTPEMIEDGINGLLFDPGNSVQLANHLQVIAMSREKRQRLATAARQTAEMRFQLSRMVGEIETFLKAVLTETRSHPESWEST